jgi:hypothetical protein
VIAITTGYASPNMLRIDFNRQAHGAVHRGRQRLRPAHAPQAASEEQFALQTAAKMLLRYSSKGLVCALQNALSTDINPTAGGHLAIHRQAQALIGAEVLPIAPGRHQVGIGD